MQSIPFYDIRRFHEPLDNEIMETIKDTYINGQFVLGEQVKIFEESFASYCNVKGCVSVGNGLDALHIILRSYGIGYGDEVIIPANTFIATALAVSYAGATPILVEPSEDSFNLDPALVESNITKRTKAIIAVHLYGQPADMQPLKIIAERNGLKLIEDSAQAHGASYHGARTGSLGDASAFSFYPGKNLGALGDGGAICSNDGKILEKAAILRNYGSKIKYVHDEMGFNSRLDTLQAAVLSVKLKHLDLWNQDRSRIAQRYIKKLQSSAVRLPITTSGIEHAWHLFVVRHLRRDALRDALKSAGVETIIHYPIPIHRQTAYIGKVNYLNKLLITELLCNTVLSLPMFPGMTDDEIDRVSNIINDFGD